MSEPRISLIARMGYDGLPPSSLGILCDLDSAFLDPRVRGDDGSQARE